MGGIGSQVPTAAGTGCAADTPAGRPRPSLRACPKGTKVRLPSRARRGWNPLRLPERMAPRLRGSGLRPGPPAHAVHRLASPAPTSVPGLTALALAACACGCATYTQRTAGALADFQNGHLEQAEASFADPKTTGSDLLGPL